MLNILLVDDEVELTDSLQQVLSREGYQVNVANTGQLGLDLAVNQDYDLMVLDWMLPQLSGLDLCRQLRSQGKTAPVLFLTAKDTLDDRVRGLDAGADDYLVKPFELRELLARVRALLRRSAAANVEENQSRLTVGALELDRENLMVYQQGIAIALSEKEVNLLSLLMSHPGQLVTHEQIYQKLWSNEAQPGSNVIAALIRLLRRKIESKGEETLIQTVYGKGYRLGE